MVIYDSPPAAPSSRAAVTPAHPFLAHMKRIEVSPGSFVNKCVVQAGTFSGIMPKISSTELDADPAPTLTLGSGVNKIYLKVNALCTSANGFVYTYSFDSIDVETSGSVPDDVVDGGAGTDIPATFYILIATFDGEVKTGQYVATSLGGRIEDDDTATSTPYLYWTP